MLLALIFACHPSPTGADWAVVADDTSATTDPDDSGSATDTADTGAPCDDPGTWYTDADGDGYGDPDAPVEACEQPEGTVGDRSDCEDGDPTAWPGSHATEVPGDGVDQDCDGLDACRDLNCDGWPDLVFAQTDRDEDYAIDSVIYLGGADGYSSERTWSVPTVGGMGVDAADVNHDGYIDLAFASVQDGERREIDSYVYTGGPEGFSAERRAALPTIGCADVTLADVDQDGWTDAVFANRFRGGTPSVDTYSNDSVIYWNDGGAFSAERRTDLPTVGAARSRVADLDGDGFNDVVFANGIADLFFTNSSSVFWGSTDGWSEADSAALTTVFPEGLGVGDVNGDGDLDIVFTTWLCTLYCGDASMIYWGHGGRDYSDDGRTQLEDAVGGTDVQIDDLDGDGFADLVVANGGVDWTGSFATESYVYYGRAGSFSPSDRIALPTSAASECGVRDLDGDGFKDIVCASHYAPDGGGDEVSQIYWGSADGFDASNLTELPTTHAAGMTIVGSVVM